MKSAQALRALLLKPWIWTAIVAVVAYCDQQALRGSLVYDDNGSIKSNVVVNGNVPFLEVSLRVQFGHAIDSSSTDAHPPLTGVSLS